MSWNIRYIWMIVFLLLSLICKAQDTVKITDNHYLSYLDNPDYNIISFNHGSMWGCGFSESYYAPTDTTTIYGVVIPMTDWIWHAEKDSCNNMSVALCRTNAFFDTIDSVNANSMLKKVFLNAGYVESGHLVYSSDDSRNLFVHGLEVYFDHPHSVEEDLPDTFFIAKHHHIMFDYWNYCPHYYIFYVYVTAPQQPNFEWHTYLYSHESGYHVMDESLTTSQAIPIVKLRSDPPKGFRLLSREGNSATVAWRGSYDVESYQLSIGLFGENPDDGEIVTLPADSAEYNTTLTYTFDNLDYGVRHAVWIRKSCRYTTAGYDTLVWGPWSSPAAFFMVGIDEVDNIGNTFRISPNPTSGTVTVELAQPAPYAYLHLIDLQGRVLEEWIMRGERQTLDVSRHPAGTYLLKMTTPAGTAVRQVAVVKN